MIAEITEPTTPAAFAAVPQSRAPSAAVRRPVPTCVNPNSRVIVAPDPLDAIVEVGKDAGPKGHAKLLKRLWTLGVPLLLAV
jgi:hypothetical protein